MKRCALLAAAASVVLAAGAGTARAQAPGLPFTEDFLTIALMDPAKTTANWSTAEQKVFLAWRRALYGAFGAGTVGTPITADTDDSCAVAIGDMDGDGHLDVVVGNAGVNRLYVNDGAGGFSIGGDIGTDTDTTVTIALGDVDHDGDLDVVAGNSGAGEVNRLYLGNGDGTFAAAGDITADAHVTYDMALGDVDGDGWLDVVVGNDGQANRLYLNDGTGGFPAGADITADAHVTYDMALGDVDGDGWLDVVAGNGSQVNRLYLNDGAGGFPAGGDITAEAADTNAIAVGDMDGDGWLDVVAGNSGVASRLYLNDGTGGFPAGANITADTYSVRAVELGDVDSDGDLDVAFGNVSQETRLYLNNGTPAPFSGVSGADVTGDANDTEDIAAGDVDSDGDLDIVAVNWAQTNKLYLNLSSADPFAGTAGTDVTADADKTRVIAVGDVNGDGRLDVVAGTDGQAAGEFNRLYLNDGAGDPFDTVTGTDITADIRRTFAIALGDMDSDGDLDVVTGNIAGQTNRLYLNDGAGDPFDTVTGIDITGDTGNTVAIALGDVDRDGDLDVVAGNSGQVNRLYLNNGAGIFAAGTDITTDPHGTFAVALGDVDSDGDLDVVAGNFGFQTNRLYLNDGAGDPFDTVTGSDITADADDTAAVALADVDADGHLDLVVGNEGEVNRLYLNNGTVAPFSGVAGATITSDIHSSGGIALADVDADGDLDVVVGNGGSPNRLYVNDGAGGFPAGADITADAHFTEAIALGDLDSDGGVDLVAGNYTQANRLYLSGGAPISFSGVAAEDITADADDTAGIAVGDVDSDGDLDVVAGNYGAGSGETNRLYLNNGTTDPFGGVAGADITGDADSTAAVALGDLDSDGDLDLAAGNVSGGANRLYPNSGGGVFVGGTDITGEVYETRALVLGDVDSDGDLDAVTGNLDEINRLYLNDGAGDPFDTVTGSDITTDAHATSSAALGDVDADGDFDFVATNRGQTNRLYLNAGAGAFPAGADLTGDIADSTAVALGDVDSDGDLDVVVGNLGGTNRLYLNSGGAFAGGTDITTDAGDTRSIVLTDVNGDGCLDVVAGNAAVNRLYLNNGTASPFAGVTGTNVTSDAEGTNALAAGDVDDDGCLDIVAGNSNAANRLYRARPFVAGAGTAVSLEVDTETANIADALLTRTTSEPANTGVVWFLSNDGGACWSRVTPGVRFAFPAAGSDLRWRAELRSLSPALTPEITQVHIEGPVTTREDLGGIYGSGCGAPSSGTAGALGAVVPWLLLAFSALRRRAVQLRNLATWRRHH